MKAIEILAGSVVVSTDGTIWYACGDWQLLGVENCIPCVPAYVPLRDLPEGFIPNKQITVGNRFYAKIFGHYGLSLTEHREHIFPRMANMINDITLGRVAFLSWESIEHISNPQQFREVFLDNLAGSRPIFKKLADALSIDITNIGISGSVLAVGNPSWRHEIDFSVMGENACTLAYQKLAENRLNGLFSEDSMPPYHMPFKFEGKWFDPHFSDPHRERVLHRASISLEERLSNVTLQITNDAGGIFFPTFYGTENGMRLLTFRPSHRGLYRKGNNVFFETIGTGIVKYTDGVKEKVYLVVNEEWGEKI